MQVKKIQKRQSADNNNTESISKKTVCNKGKIRGENLLLNYTYYLDDYHNRKVILGFDPQTFKAKIVFHLHGRFPVSADFIEWSSLYPFLNKLQQTLSSDEEPADLEKKNTRKQYKIPIGGEGNSIILHYSEILKLFNLMEWFNLVMFHNNNAVDSVKNFYKLYCEKCKEKGVVKLTAKDFFLPVTPSYMYVNYTRLFNEIPSVCNLSTMDIILYDILIQ